MEKWVHGFEHFRQFKTLTEDKLKKTLEKIDDQKLSNLIVLPHQYNHTKYIIRELKPNTVLWINGSWKHVLHYQPEYWECIDAESEIKRLPAFINEEKAHKYAKDIVTKNEKELSKKLEILESQNSTSPDEIMQFAHEISRLSWDWTGETGAVITKNNEILGYSHNKVVPFESFMLLNGALREKHRTPIGEFLEFGETIHAETAAIVDLCQKGHNLEKTHIYTTKFPCPICARNLAATPIEKIYYSGEYSNKLGYTLLEKSDKELIRI
jgi:deoxycytidylate deaminase